MTGPRLLERMARNNAWANARLFAAVAALPPGAWSAPRAGFFPSIRATLNHSYAVDRYYIDAATDGGLGARAYAGAPKFIKLGALDAAQSASDARLVAFCAGLAADDLGRAIVTDRGAAGRVEEGLAELLLHLFQHQVHHRGQVHNMLSQAGAHPPQLDEFHLAYDRHPTAAGFDA